MKKIKSLILAAVMMFSLITPTIANADYMEYSVADDGWLGFTSSGVGSYDALDATVERTQSAAHAGRFSGYLMANFVKSGNTFIDLRYVVPGSLLKPSTKYKFKFWVKAKNSGISYLKVNKSGGEEMLGSGGLAWYGTFNWEQRTEEFTTPSSLGNVIIIFRSEGYETAWHNNSPSEIWVDDLGLYEVVNGVTSDKNILEDRNPGFETVDLVPPGDVSGISVDVLNSTAMFSWTEPEDSDFAKTRIYDITDGGNKLIKELNKGTVSYISGGLTNEKEYEYLFVAVDKMGNESEGVKVTFIPVIPPSAPAVTADDVNNVITGADETMEIKVDAGEWTDYTDGLVFEGNHVVLVRVKAHGHYPVSPNTLLVFKEAKTVFEKLPVQLTKTEFYKNSFKFSGIVQNGMFANVSAVIRKGESFEDYLYAKQLKTDENGVFEAEAVLADVFGGKDMSGKYVFAVNSAEGLKSQEIIIDFASETLRKEAVEHLNTSENLRDTVEKYKSTFTTLGIDVAEYMESTEKQKYIDEVVEKLLPIEVSDEALQNVFVEAQFVYDINNAESISEILNLILASPYEFKYKENTISEMLAENEDIPERALEIMNMTDDFSSAEEIISEFAFGCALYNVCHAQYSTLAEVLKENETELGIADEKKYDKYLEESDNTDVNKYFVRNAYPDKLSGKTELLDLLEKSVKQADEDKKGGTGGGGGGGGTSISPSKGLTNVGAITAASPEVSEKKDDSIFADMQNSKWAENAVNTLYKKGIVSGGGDGRFYPERNITREEFVKLVIEAFAIDVKGGTPEFTDAVPGAWYSGYVNTAAELGIVTGKDNGTFGIGENITRQDMAVIIYRTAGIIGYTFNRDKDAVFADSDIISEYAKEAVEMLSGSGIINGMENSVFAPLENATRAQGAQIIYNVLSERGDV